MASQEVVMGFGTFDGIHPGHHFYLKQLKALGKCLIVVIARDQNVIKIKGRRPYFDEQSRLQAVETLQIADKVVLGHLSDFYEVIRRHEPTILGFGYDQKVNEAELKKLFPHLMLIRVESHHPEKYKSSLLKKELGLNE